MNGRRFSWLRTFGCALRGIVSALRSERNMRFHAAAAVLVVASGILLKIGRADWLWIGAAIAAVMVAELFNTAVERVVDLASPGEHPLAKSAKDTAAGAVLAAAVFASAVGIAVLGPPLWRMITG